MEAWPFGAPAPAVASEAVGRNRLWQLLMTTMVCLYPPRADLYHDQVYPNAQSKLPYRRNHNATCVSRLVAARNEQYAPTWVLFGLPSAVVVDLEEGSLMALSSFCLLTVRVKVVPSNAFCGLEMTCGISEEAVVVVAADRVCAAQNWVSRGQGEAEQKSLKSSFRSPSKRVCVCALRSRPRRILCYCQQVQRAYSNCATSSRNGWRRRARTGLSERLQLPAGRLYCVVSD